MFLNDNMRYNTLTVCLISAIAVLLGIVLYLYSKSRNVENLGPVQQAPSNAAGPARRPEQPMNQQGESSGATPSFVLFHATWCPHCKDVLPIWQQLKAGAKGNIQIIDIESKDPALSQHQIQGFPTIRFFPQGLSVPQNYKDYTGPRTLDGMIQFLSSL